LCAGGGVYARKEPQLPEAINLSTFDPDEEVKRLAAEGRWSELRARSEWQRECCEFYRYGYLEGVRAAQETARGKLPALEDWASVDLKRMGRTG